MMALPPGVDEDAAVTDLSALAAELSRRGYVARLDTCPGPCLILGHRDVRQPQRIYADGEFFAWGWVTGRVAFSLRCLSPSLAADDIKVLMTWHALTQEGQDPGEPSR